jgi:hypothetical protein
MEIYLVGEDFAHPGVFRNGNNPLTYKELFKVGGYDVTSAARKWRVAYPVFLYPNELRAYVIGEELVKKWSKTPLYISHEVRLPRENRSRPILLVWSGSPKDWLALNKAAAKSVIVSGVGALMTESIQQRIESLKQRGIAVKVVSGDTQGRWPPQYDELMEMARRAQELGHWPGEASDEGRIRNLLVKLIMASQRNDAQQIARLTTLRMEPALGLVERLRGYSTQGLQPGVIDKIIVRDDQAIAHTQISEVLVEKEKKRLCLLYQLRRNKRGSKLPWTLESVETVDRLHLKDKVEILTKEKSQAELHKPSASVPTVPK